MKKLPNGTRARIARLQELQVEMDTGDDPSSMSDIVSEFLRLRKQLRDTGVPDLMIEKALYEIRTLDDRSL